jgi:hypothetical protein
MKRQKDVMVISKKCNKISKFQEMSSNKLARNNLIFLREWRTVSQINPKNWS